MTIAKSDLRQYGWNTFFEERFQPYAEKGYSAGRIAIEHTHMYTIYSEYGELLGEISGKMRHEAQGTEAFPAVGDWVVLSPRPEEKKATIHAVLPRKSKFSRKAAGPNMEEQILASNVDTLFLVSSLNKDFSVRRLERYLIMAWESGAIPVVILSKADLCEDVVKKILEVEAVAIGVSVYVVSSLTGQGFDGLKTYIREGSTVALLGSSGVGKSTLINRLVGHEVLKVQEIREDDEEGRHTTTHRELIVLPEGGIVVDTPGMREFGLWDGSGGIQETFEDITALGKQCRFADCQHEKEPGCAVRGAVREGTLSNDRLNSFWKLQKELRFLEEKQQQVDRIQAKSQRKSVTAYARENRVKV
jgi:ribosome biogenesis GTPase / thiamine phosphate phosphatase